MPDTKDPKDDLRESAQRIWLAGLGALAVAEEEGTKLFHSLVERGSEVQSRGEERASEAGEAARTGARSAADGVSDAFDRQVSAILERLGVPTREEIQRLTRRVEELNAKLAAMEAREARQPTASDPTSPPTPAAPQAPTTPPPGEDE